MIDKVYVVTAGQYSDYHIERVFADKSKAEEFCKWIDKWDEGQVEEYQISDNIPYKPVYIIRIELEWYETGQEKIHTYIHSDVDFYKNYDGYLSYDFIGRHELTVVRTYENVTDFDEKKYKDKLIKYIYDLKAFVKSLIADGYDEKMIRETINNNSSVLNKVNNE